MKENWKKNVIEKYLLLFFIFILFNSCKEETMVVTSDAKRQIFKLDFSVRDIVFNDKPTETYINASFFAPGISDTPDVYINGVKMVNFIIDSSNNNIDLYGWCSNIPFKSKTSFIISSGSKATTGTFIMPSKPYNVTCSGIPLTDSIPVWSEFTAIPVDSIYHFKWECDNYDYFSVHINYGGNFHAMLFDKEFVRIKTSDWTIGDIPLSLYIGVFKGIIFKPGTKPNYTGTYGSGYVSATYSTEFRYVPN